MYASVKDWELHRAKITRLYWAEHKPLKDVIIAMSTEHEFNATSKMYKTRFHLWGLDKNVKGCEAAMILRIRAERQAIGKRSAFKLRGREVDLRRILKYERRKQSRAHAGLTNPANDPFSVDEIQCYTPDASNDEELPEDEASCDEEMLLVSPVSISSKDPLEIVLADVQSYILGSFESRKWTPELMNQWIPAASVNEKERSVASDLYTMICHASEFLKDGEYHLSGISLRKGFGLVAKTIANENAFTIWELLNTVAYLSEMGWDDVLSSFLQHISEMSSALRSERHPLPLILSRCVQFPKDRLLQALATMRECAADQIERTTGRSSISSLLFRLGWLRAISVTQSPDIVEEQLKARLRTYLREDGHDSLRCLLVLNQLGNLLLENGRFADTETVARQMIACTTPKGPDPFSRGRALSLLARSQLAQQKWVTAESCTRFLVDHNTEHFGARDPLTIASLLLLNDSFRATGRLEEATVTISQIQNLTYQNG